MFKFVSVEVRTKIAVFLPEIVTQIRKLSILKNTVRLPVALIPRAFAQGLFACFVDATTKPVFVFGTFASVFSNAVLTK